MTLKEIIHVVQLQVIYLMLQQGRGNHFSVSRNLYLGSQLRKCSTGSCSWPSVLFPQGILQPPVLGDSSWGQVCSGADSSLAELIMSSCGEGRQAWGGLKEGPKFPNCGAEEVGKSCLDGGRTKILPSSRKQCVVQQGNIWNYAAGFKVS